MKNSAFQIIFLAVFGALAAAGLLIFAFAVGGEDESAVIGRVEIWGTLDGEAFDSVFEELVQYDPSITGISYVQKDSTLFDQELTNALAENRAPDMYIVGSDEAVKTSAKVTVIPYESVSRKQFKDWYIEAANPFLGLKGIIAIPFIVDPLILYWNRDLFAAAGYPEPPRYWDEVPQMAQRLTVRDTTGAIQTSAIALGTYRNVEDAKAILSMLITQAVGESQSVSDTIVGMDESGQQRSLLSLDYGRDEPPSVSALRFYTEFANPAKTDYSWSGSFESARQAFAHGQAALYVGFASEDGLIRAINPNLNYSVAPVPQVRDSKRPSTFARVYGFAVPLASKNRDGAFLAAQRLNTATSSTAFAKRFGIGSASREALKMPTDNDHEFINRMALVSKNWADPDPKLTDEIFRAMIENTASGAASPIEAVSRANQELEHIFRE